MLFLPQGTNQAPV